MSRESLQPKSIALEMFDSQLSFSAFLKKLSPLDKSKRVTQQEGLLLRFLSQVHKTMKHNIPDEFKTDEVLEIEAFLLATINATDSSLLREWEALKNLETIDFEQDLQLGSEAVVSAEHSFTATSPESADGGNAPETETEFRLLQARARVEAQLFGRHLALGKWKEAAKAIRHDTADLWDQESLRARVISGGRRPFWKETYSIQIELDTALDGLQVFGEILDEENGLPWLEFEVLAPWPSNSFEVLLQLQSLD